MIIDEKPIEGWSDLSALVAQQFKKRWIYRGVRKSHYTLRPGIGRPGIRKDAQGFVLPYSFPEEQQQLRQFMREAGAKFEWEPRTRKRGDKEKGTLPFFACLNILPACLD